jgi:mannose-6-phosphate isomerase-like protein (cupin superfamily)
MTEKIQLSEQMWMRELCRLEAVSVDFIEIAPGAHKEAVVHWECDEVLFILEGELELLVGESRRNVRAGDCIPIPRNTVHGSVNHTSAVVRMLAINSPPYQFQFEHPAQ